MSNKSALVIGAGIVGLATARALAIKGYRVTILERTDRAVGASVRNFGMVWPIGQPEGKLYERALRSRSVWNELSREGIFWSDPAGSFHLASHADEWQVLGELAEAFGKNRPVELMSPDRAKEKSGAILSEKILGALFSADEMIVDPREAIRSIPGYLKEKWDVRLLTPKCVSYICEQTAYVSNTESYDADIIFICNGADFETLYPEQFASLPLTRCKLQMMRMGPQPPGWRMGPALCGGLSLIHYKSFEAAPSLPRLRQRFQNEMPDFLKYGIHVMVSQNAEGMLTVGDSHEYGTCPEPFDEASVNDRILDYLKSFAVLPNEKIAETWNGVYAKCTDGATEVLLNPEPGVYILNGLGGAGMTLSFGLAEEVVAGL